MPKTLTLREMLSLSLAWVSLVVTRREASGAMARSNLTRSLTSTPSQRVRRQGLYRRETIRKTRRHQTVIAFRGVRQSQNQGLGKYLEDPSNHPCVGVTMTMITVTLMNQGLPGRYCLRRNKVLETAAEEAEVHDLSPNTTPNRRMWCARTPNRVSSVLLTKLKVRFVAVAGAEAVAVTLAVSVPLRLRKSRVRDLLVSCSRIPRLAAHKCLRTNGQNLVISNRQVGLKRPRIDLVQVYVWVRTRIQMQKRHSRFLKRSWSRNEPRS
jgi:hypothetical protein